jgi:hypothetical protein
MPTHTNPSRRQNRTRGDGLARNPFAAGTYLAENPNDGKLHAAPMSYATRTLANLDAIATFENRDSRDRVSFPGRDSLGRVNPRMARRQYP